MLVLEMCMAFLLSVDAFLRCQKNKKLFKKACASTCAGVIAWPIEFIFVSLFDLATIIKYAQLYVDRFEVSDLQRVMFGVGYSVRKRHSCYHIGMRNHAAM